MKNKDTDNEEESDLLIQRRLEGLCPYCEARVDDLWIRHSTSCKVFKDHEEKVSVFSCENSQRER